jgi:hypothetical protein
VLVKRCGPFVYVKKNNKKKDKRKGREREKGKRKI